MDTKKLYDSIGSAEEFWRGVENAGQFFAGIAPVHKALQRIARLLHEADIPYAIVGGLALYHHGYRRVTVDIDLLLTHNGFAALRAKALALGYSARTRGLRDTDNDVAIDVLLTGDFPGDKKPKPVSFPDPARVSLGGELRFLQLATLVELKLASGLAAPHRLKDLADILELIRAANLPRELGNELDASVRAKYDELWVAAQTRDEE